MSALMTIRKQSANDKSEASPPAGKISVAFALNERATVIDFGGPWEVFQDVSVSSGGETEADRSPFHLFTVAPQKKPIIASGGMRILPDYSVTEAPQPNVVVVPAQASHGDMLAWLRDMAAVADLIMSVCTGAFELGRAGLLEGLTATTHHDYYDRFAAEFPSTELVRGLRFVEHERIATAGGLTSGIDLALRVVARYFGFAIAAQTAVYMEYTSDSWSRDPVSHYYGAAHAYRSAPLQTDDA